MPLFPGDNIGPHIVDSLLGNGGMGEVYRARFQRETQTLASLSHPNIASIYGLETNAIAMELVEGATLQGPLPLGVAQKRGIIHRASENPQALGIALVAGLTQSGPLPLDEALVNSKKITDRTQWTL